MIPFPRNRVRSSGRFVALVSAAALVLSAGSLPAGATPPDDDKTPPTPTGRQRGASAAPRPMSGLGGVRAKLPRPIKGLPRPHTNVRRSFPTAPAPGEAPAGVPPATPQAAAETVSRAAMAQRAAALLLLDFDSGRVSDGFTGVRDPFRGGLVRESPDLSLRRALQENDLRGVEVGTRVRVPVDSGAMEAAAQRIQRSMTEQGVAEGTARQIGAALTPVGALEAARERYLREGYREVELAPGDHAFVKGDDAAMERLERMKPGIAETARPRTYCVPGEAYRGWCESRGVVTNEGRDPFVRYGEGVAPEPPMDPYEQPAEWAVQSLREGRFAEAAESYRTYLATYPDDTVAMRLRGVALLLDGQGDSGADVLLAAYTTDPSLAWTPVARDLFPDRPETLRRAVTSAVGAAHRTKSAAPWLAAIVLMQAEGREAQAANLVGRAEAAGLDRAVVHELKLALGR